MFSFNRPKTIELLYIATMFWKRVDIVRVLTTKSGSGEIYVVCLDFIGTVEDDVMERLYKYLEGGEGVDEWLVEGELYEKFVKRIYNCHKLLTLRRITTINQFMFRFFNHDYVDKNAQIKTFVKEYTIFYMKYFMEYIKMTDK